MEDKENTYFNILVKKAPNHLKYFHMERKLGDSKPPGSSDEWEYIKHIFTLERIANVISNCNIIMPKRDYHILSESFHNKNKPLKIGIKKEGEKHLIIRALNIEEQRDLITLIEKQD